MPRPNPGRLIASEASLAKRIAYEREARGMSYDGLASRMTQAGCPINGSALYKIEKGDPPRRITVDELVALSRVFEIKLPGLLNPPETVLNKDLVVKLRAMAEALRATLTADANYKAALRDLARFLIEHPETATQLDSADPDDFSMAGLIETLRGVDEGEDLRYADLLQRIADHGE